MSTVSELREDNPRAYRPDRRSGGDRPCAGERRATRPTWICKPGQADDLCAGTIDGATNPPPGEESQPLGYTRPTTPPIDCFYLYPTQSEQPGPNANLDKDPPIRRVVVQQARMFSSVCDVYAPMYRQVTLQRRPELATTRPVETAYQSAKAAFQDYLKNYNDGRGFIMIGHSQGSAHTARLIDELVDTNAKLRKRFVGAIAPGANIAVPIGKAVGGLFDNVPACTEVGEYGCVTAFSTYNDVPGPERGVLAARHRLLDLPRGRASIRASTRRCAPIPPASTAATAPCCRSSTSTTCSACPPRRPRRRGRASPTTTRSSASARTAPTG